MRGAAQLCVRAWCRTIVRVEALLHARQRRARHPRLPDDDSERRDNPAAHRATWRGSFARRTFLATVVLEACPTLLQPLQGTYMYTFIELEQLHSVHALSSNSGRPCRTSGKRFGRDFYNQLLQLYIGHSTHAYVQ